MGRNGKNLNEVCTLAINDGKEEAVKGNAPNADRGDDPVATWAIACAKDGRTKCLVIALPQPR